MKIKTILLAALLSISATCIQAYENKEAKDSITVYVFLHESCLISQYYTLPLRTLHQTYADSNVQFIGLFPNLSSKPDKIQAFKESYEIPFDLKTDYYHTKTKALGATVTPEVVVYNESKEEIIYKGRIDDSYARVGKRKRIVSTTELNDVLEAVSKNQPVLTGPTTAIGCFIGKNKLN